MRLTTSASAGLFAAALLAISSLHVRQSPLVSPDVSVGLVYAIAVWFALRLLDRESLGAYLWAGLLVGLAAATKYPGALAGGAVLAAHLLAHRSFRDRRLWLAGVASVVVLICTSPYVILDPYTFLSDFSYEVSHMSEGRGNAQTTWWYHLSVGLRHGLGLPGLIAAFAGVAFALRTHRRETLVLLAGLLGYWLVMGMGRLSFVRYSLPMLPLAAALAGVALAHVERRLRLPVALLGLAVPTWAAVSTADILATPDTRSEARDWMAEHLPDGSTCCTFGGWVGDVPVPTLERLAYRLARYEVAFGREPIDRQFELIDDTRPQSPLFSYAVPSRGDDGELGDLDLIDTRQCAYVILHRHPLSYSTVDDSVAAAVAARGELLVKVSAIGLEATKVAAFDAMDGYYIPLGGAAGLHRGGPDIEIWRIPEYAPGSGRQTTSEVLARAYLRTVSITVIPGENRNERARRELGVLVRALQLEPGCPEATIPLERVTRVLDVESQESGGTALALGTAHYRAGNLQRSILYHQRAYELGQERELACLRLGDTAIRAGRPGLARMWYERFLLIAPQHKLAPAVRARLQ